MCVLYHHSSHVMNELLETERAYVEELLCVLEVGDHCHSEHISAQGLDSSLHMKDNEIRCLPILIYYLYCN